MYECMVSMCVLYLVCIKEENLRHKSKDSCPKSSLLRIPTPLFAGGLSLKVSGVRSTAAPLVSFGLL